MGWPDVTKRLNAHGAFFLLVFDSTLALQGAVVPVAGESVSGHASDTFFRAISKRNLTPCIYWDYRFITTTLLPR